MIQHTPATWWTEILYPISTEATKITNFVHSLLMHEQRVSFTFFVPSKSGSTSFAGFRLRQRIVSYASHLEIRLNERNENSKFRANFANMFINLRNKQSTINTQKKTVNTDWYHHIHRWPLTYASTRMNERREQVPTRVLFVFVWSAETAAFDYPLWRLTSCISTCDASTRARYCNDGELYSTGNRVSLAREIHPCTVFSKTHTYAQTIFFLFIIVFFPSTRSIYLLKI